LEDEAFDFEQVGEAQAEFQAAVGQGVGIPVIRKGTGVAKMAGWTGLVYPAKPMV
jgi:hypothetical protein